MIVYGLHDAKRVIATLLPLAKSVIGFIALTLFLDIFFSGMPGSSGQEDVQGTLVVYFALSTALNYLAMSFFLGRIIERIFNLPPMPPQNLIRKHLPGYLLATFILVLLVTPIFMVASALFFSQNNQALFYTIMISLKILPIYVFPLVFITGEAKHAVFTGIKCLFGNVSDSLFLIFLSVLVFLFEGYVVPSLGDTPFIAALVATGNVCFSLYIFTAAAWVMKEKIYSGDGINSEETLH